MDETGSGFIFRVGAITANGDDAAVEHWISHNEPYRLLSDEQNSSRMDAPRVSLGEMIHTAIASWEEALPSSSLLLLTPNHSGKYEIQMRENLGGSDWTTVAASFAGLEVRKKNLTSPNGYQFRVRPAAREGGRDVGGEPNNDDNKSSTPDTNKIPFFASVGIDCCVGIVNRYEAIL